MFANPVFLFAAMAGAIPVLVHLIFRRQRRAIDFPTLMFMRKVELKLASRRKLKEIILLALRALALILFALALARPGIRSQAASTDGRITTSADCVLILDNSASMGFKSSTGTRWDEARAQAIAVLNLLGAEGRAAILTTVPCEAADEVSSLTSDKEKLLNALKIIQPSDGAGPLPATLTHAAEILKQGSTAPNQEIYLFSDLQRNAFKEEPALRQAVLKFASQLVFFICPTSVSAIEKNVSILSVTTDPRPKVAGRKITLQVRVKNHSAQEITTHLCTTLKDLPPQNATLTLAGGTQQDVPVELTLGSEGFVTGQVALDADDTPFDNVWPFYINVRGPVRVLVISEKVAKRDEVEDSFYLRKALDPTGDGRLSGIHVTHLAQRDAGNVKLEAYDAVVLCGCSGLPAPTAQTLYAYVEKGGGLMIFSGPHEAKLATDNFLTKLLPGRVMGELKIQPPQEPLNLRATQMASPYFDDSRTVDGRVEFKHVAILKMLKVEVAANERTQVLAEAGGFPALIASQRGLGKILWWTTCINAEDSNLPLMPSFLSLLHCSVSVMCNAQWQAIERKAGQPVSLELTSTNTPKTLTLFDPLEKSYDVPIQAHRFQWNQTGKAGIYRLSAKSDAKSETTASAPKTPAAAPSVSSVSAVPTGFAIVPDVEESEADYISASEAARLIPAPKVTLISSVETLTDAIAKSRQGQDLFGIFVIAALLMVLAEALLANLLGVRNKTVKSSTSTQNATATQDRPSASNFNLPPPSIKKPLKEEARV